MIRFFFDAIVWRCRFDVRYASMITFSALVLAALPNVS